MFRKDMDDLICSMHKEIVKKDNPGQRISRMTGKIVTELLKDEKMERDSLGQNELHSMLMLTASAAEEHGFSMGFKCAARLLVECIAEE